MLLGVEIKDWASMLSAALALTTAIVTLAGARGPSRVRDRLDSETQIWGRLPEGTEQREAMWALACRSLDRLAQLEDPERRRRRRGYVVLGGFTSAILAANAVWAYRNDGAWGAVESSVTLLVIVAFAVASNWLTLRSPQAVAGGRPTYRAGKNPD